MALRAIRNTYGYENVGYGVERRLLIIAGQVVPPHLRLEDPAAVEDELGPNNPFYLMQQAPADAPAAASVDSVSTPAAAPAAAGRARGASGKFTKRGSAA